MALRIVRGRRWVRFSLRTFLLVVTVFAIWIGFQTYRAQLQSRAVSALQDLFVQISYDWQHDPSDYMYVLANVSPPTPGWLRDAVGEHFFQTVVRVNFEQTQTHDSDLQWLDALPDIRFLSLFDTPVTNEGMRHVGAIPRLQTLYFFDTQIGDDGLKHLRNATTLREIQCGNTPITDAGLAHLENLNQLEKLWLGGTKVSDQGLRHLDSLKKLQFLDLRETNVTVESVAKLRESRPNCKILY